MIPVVEELLRLEPPVQYLPNRAALEDITIDGTTIPKGSQLTILIGAANRDRAGSPTRTGSTPTAPTTSTSASAAAFTTASARRSPGWRCTWRSPRWPAGSTTRD